MQYRYLRALFLSIIFSIVLMGAGCDSSTTTRTVAPTYRSPQIQQNESNNIDDDQVKEEKKEVNTTIKNSVQIINPASSTTDIRN